MQKTEASDIVPCQTTLFNNSVLERVKAFMKNNANTEYNSWTLDKKLCIKDSTARSCLSKLSSSGHVVRTRKGFYRAAIEFDNIPAWLRDNLYISGIKIQANFPELHDNGINGLKHHPKTTQKDGQIYNIQFESGNATIFVHWNADVDIHYQRPNHPLSYLDYAKFIAFLHGIFPSFNKMNPFLVSIELGAAVKLLPRDEERAANLEAIDRVWNRAMLCRDRRAKEQGDVCVQIRELQTYLEVVKN